jgi:hypothetical protein
MSTDEIIVFVPLEDWYEELADESLDPLNILMDEEENPLNYEITIMSTTTLHTNKPAFDLDAWIKTAAVVTDQPAAALSVAIPCPEWLTVKNGQRICEANAFAVTAGVVKAARQVLDAISYTRLQYEAAVEDLHMQTNRAYATGKETDPSGPQGFNPDGNEYDNAVAHAAEGVEELERVLDNGKRIMAEIISWIGDHAADLNLKVTTGYTVRKGIIGNEIRTQRYELLTPETLMYAIADQREFIRNNRA